MAKVSITEQHDWLAIRVTFADGSKANVTWSRNGERVTLDPPDPRKAERLSLVVMQNLEGIRGKRGDYPIKNLGEAMRAMEKVAQVAQDFDAYVAGIKTALHVSGERDAPKDAPKETVATLSEKRGWHLDAAFPSGERVSLKINRSSVGLSLTPNVPSQYDDIIKLVFGVKQAGVLDDATLAKAAHETALSADGVVAWLEALRSDLFPRRAPGR